MVKETRVSGEQQCKGKTDYKTRIKESVAEATKDLETMDVDGFLLVICNSEGHVQVHNVGNPPSLLRILEGMDSARKEMMKMLLRVAVDKLEQDIENG